MIIIAILSFIKEAIKNPDIVYDWMEMAEKG